MVLLLGSISGLLVFALSNALHVAIVRARGHKVRSTAVSSRFWPMLVAALALSSGAFVLNLFLGRVDVNGDGLLVGDDLFVVSKRQGFVPSYPNTSSVVKKGDPILVVRRDAGPDEIAAAENKREVLQHELEFIKSDALEVDPLVVREYTLAESALRDLEERAHKELDTRDTLVRVAPQQKLENETRRATVDKDLTSVQGELDQIRLSLESAVKLFENAERAMKGGLIPSDEYETRRERVNVLRSRQADLETRAQMLRTERGQLANLASNTEGTFSDQLALRSGEITALNRRIATGRQTLDEAARRLDQDKVRAAAQRDQRVKQIQIQIHELDALIDPSESTLSSRAPWDGVVGFRESSPASVRSDLRPLLVLFRPGTITARLQVAASVSAAPGQKLDIRVRTLMPETVNTAVSGELIERVPLPDDMVELRIACQPASAAVRDLAMGTTVPVGVVVRRPDLLARLKLSRAGGAVIIGLLSFGIAEIRLHLRRRRQRASTVAAQEPPRRRMDWGGNPQEVQEFVVGVGLVPARLRSVASATMPAPVRFASQENLLRLDQPPLALQTASNLAATRLDSVTRQ
jgi:hypothetical protein